MSENPFIHETSGVDEDVKIGDDTKIWHFCHISKGVRIGSDVVLGQNCFVAPEVRIGDGCRIQNNVSIYSGVMLEDAVFVGPSAVFTNVNTPRADFPRKESFKRTTVRKGASIGANATIVCGSYGRVLEEYCMVGAGSVVTKHVMKRTLVRGAPARIVGVVCVCGDVIYRFKPDEDPELGWSCGKLVCSKCGAWTKGRCEVNVIGSDGEERQ